MSHLISSKRQLTGQDIWPHPRRLSQTCTTIPDYLIGGQEVGNGRKCILWNFCSIKRKTSLPKCCPTSLFPLPIKRKNLDTFTFMRFARDFPIGPQFLPLLLSSRFSPRVYFYHKSLSPSRRMSRFTSAELAKITWQHLRKLWSLKPPHWCELEKITKLQALELLWSFGGFLTPSNQQSCGVTHHGAHAMAFPCLMCCCFIHECHLHDADKPEKI